MKPRLAVYCADAGYARWRVAAAAAGCSVLRVKTEAAMLDAACDVVVVMESPGIDVCALVGALRRRRPATFLLAAFLADSKALTVRAFKCGADDVVSLPLATVVVAARLRAMLRRCVPAPATSSAATSAVRLDVSDSTVVIDGVSIALTSSEAKLLAVLLRRSGRTVARADLLGALWKTREGVRTRSIDVHVANLRRKLSRSACRILSTPPIGYRFIPS